MLKLIGKKIFTILRWKNVYLNLCYIHISTNYLYGHSTIQHKIWVFMIFI